VKAKKADHDPPYELWARVQIVRQQPGGSWKQDGGVSDDELDREIASAKQIANKVVRPSN
jgi:hypothetical protein